MIKGKYVAVVEIDFAIDENDPTIKPFDKIRDEVRCDFTPAIQGMLGGELEGVGKVTVNQMYADLYQVQAAEECNKKPTVDVAQIVRCKACANFRQNVRGGCWCDVYGCVITPDDFCSFGERKE